MSTCQPSPQMFYCCTCILNYKPEIGISGDYNRIREKIDMNRKKTKQGNENLVNQMQKEINEVNFLLILHKVNVLMTLIG